MSQLSDYIQKLLSQGYSLGSIRSTLLNAGYSPSEIDTAFGQTTHHIHTSPLVLALLVVLALTGVGIYFFAPAPEQPLDFSADLLSPTAVPGGTVELAVHIINSNERKISATLSALVRAPNGTTYPAQKIVVVEKEVSVPLSLSLSADSASGRYTVTTKLSWGTQSKTQSLMFTVAPRTQITTTEQREQLVEIKQLTCPGGCDDQNFCTTDTCNKGICEYVPIIPCCGNRNCESEESENSCILDCGKRVTSTSIRDQAIILSKVNLAQAISTCETLAQQSYVDECLASVSDTAANKQPCEGIVSDDLRDACYIPFSYKNDFSVCEKITNQAIKNSCVTLAQVQSTNTVT